MRVFGSTLRSCELIAVDSFGFGAYTLQLLENTDLFDTGGDESENEGDSAPPKISSFLSSPPPRARVRRKKNGAKENNKKVTDVCGMSSVTDTHYFVSVSV